MSAQGWFASACGVVGVYLLSVPPVVRVAIDHPSPGPSHVVTAYCTPFMWLAKYTPAGGALMNYYEWWFPETEIIIGEIMAAPGDWAQ